MTQITREQVEAALNTLWITSESCNSDEHFETIKSYITQLEAQRQPVSDEKLRAAVDQLVGFVQEGCSARPEDKSDALGLLSIIEAALSELETLRAVSKEAQASPAWHPIETAPMDGTQILGFVPTYNMGNGGIVTMLWMKGSRSPDGGWWDNKAWVIYPTHWMPLPTPPAQEEK